MGKRASFAPNSRQGTWVASRLPKQENAPLGGTVLAVHDRDK